MRDFLIMLAVAVIFVAFGTYQAFQHNILWAVMDFAVVTLSFGIGLANLAIWIKK